MQISLSDETERLLRERMSNGNFATPDAAVRAGMLALEASEGDFQPGELDALLAEGEASGEPLDGETVLEELRKLRRTSPRQAG